MLKLSTLFGRTRLDKTALKANRPTHKKILLHPLFMMVVLCGGVFICGWTYKAVADYYQVTAIVPAPPLGQGAVITYPANGQILLSSPINVNGTCPANSYVNLYKNGTFSGTAWCTNNAFSIETDLFEGQNNLIAQDYNETNLPGPVTPGVQVTYRPSAQLLPSQPITSPAKPKPLPLLNIPGLLLSSQFHFATYAIHQNYLWTVQISGGQSPYTATVNWGDGQQSDINLTKAGYFNISHGYNQSGYYSLLITGSDQSGQIAHLQLSALIRNHKGLILSSTGYCLLATGNSSCAPPNHQSFFSYLKIKADWLLIAWPPFLIILLMLISFWLGEREEILRIHQLEQSHRLPS